MLEKDIGRKKNIYAKNKKYNNDFLGKNRKVSVIKKS